MEQVLFCILMASCTHTGSCPNPCLPFKSHFSLQRKYTFLLKFYTQTNKNICRLRKYQITLSSIFLLSYSFLITCSFCVSFLFFWTIYLLLSVYPVVVSPSSLCQYRLCGNYLLICAHAFGGWDSLKKKKSFFSFVLWKKIFLLHLRLNGFTLSFSLPFCRYAL